MPVAASEAPWERHLATALPHLAPGGAEFVRATAECTAALPPPAGEYVLDAVRGIAYGTTHDDPEVAERGRRILLRSGALRFTQ